MDIIQWSFLFMLVAFVSWTLLQSGNDDF